MRLIMHLDDPTDAILAMRAIKSSISKGYPECAYGYGDTSVFVRANKTGWAAWVHHEASLEAASAP